MRNQMLAALVALATALAVAPAPACAAGSRPRAWVSILGGHDAPGCGAPETPCATARYAHDFVIRSGGAVYMDDVGHFGEPTIVYTVSILRDAIMRGAW